MSSIWAELREPPRRVEEFALEKGATAHDLLNIIYQCSELPLPVRMRAAIAAIPYETPKLMVSAQVTENDIATLLDRRIKRYEEMKLIPQRIEHQQAVEIRPPLARTGDRRFRRI
jgi:hypothetical protein